MTPIELELILAFVQSHPDAVARELELCPLENGAELFAALPQSDVRKLINILLPPYLARLCQYLSVDIASRLLTNASASQLAAILRCVPKQKRNTLLKALPEKMATLSRLLLSYSEDSVGAWMTADIVMLPVKGVVNDALQRLAQADGYADLDALPVVDDKRSLVGLIEGRRLLLAKGETPLAHLMQASPPVLQSRSSLASAARHSGWLHHDSLAVLNRNREVVGVIRYVELRRSIDRFGEITQNIPQGDLVEGIGEAYAGTLSSLLDLFAGEPTISEGLGKHR